MLGLVETAVGAEDAHRASAAERALGVVVAVLSGGGDCIAPLAVKRHTLRLRSRRRGGRQRRGGAACRPVAPRTHRGRGGKGGHGAHFPLRQRCALLTGSLSDSSRTLLAADNRLRAAAAAGAIEAATEAALRRPREADVVAQCAHFLENAVRGERAAAISRARTALTALQRSLVCGCWRLGHRRCCRQRWRRTSPAPRCVCVWWRLCAPLSSSIATRLQKTSRAVRKAPLSIR
jgi:hypothetical protein